MSRKVAGYLPQFGGPQTRAEHEKTGFAVEGASTGTLMPDGCGLLRVTESPLL